LDLRADSEQSFAEGEELLGPVHPNRPLQVVVQIKPAGDRLAQDAEERAGDPLRYRDRAHILTREQYASAYSAKPEDVRRIAQFALQNGLQIAPKWSARVLQAAPFADRTIRLRGTASAINRAFGVRLFYVRSTDGNIYRSYLGQTSVPSEFEDVTGAVLNLDTRPRGKPNFRLSAPLGSGAIGRTVYSPIEIAQAYSFPSGVTGKGQTIAILEFAPGGARLRDLRRYFRDLGLQVPQIQTIGVGGAANAPTGLPNSNDCEVMADIEIAGAIANGANFVVYFAPNTNAGWLQAINAAIHDAVNRPSIISISWGFPEQKWTKGEMFALNEAFQAAALMGISVFIAVGDSGSTDGIGIATPHVGFPASSPWVTACGGTSLFLGASAPPESVWNSGESGGGTGGGISSVFRRPSYQAGIVYQSSGLPQRGLPDVAGHADGYRTWVDGTPFPFVGTSSVAPLWSALTALLNENIGTPLGFLNPLLYRTNLKLALKDITVGNNDTTHLVGKYVAGLGWDPCTGFGSPNGSAMLAALS
jgi:kumamolisin